jgi:uncharacterized protein with HEPN domain
MTPDDVIRIRHMIEAGESAMMFVANRTRPDIESDIQLRFAIVQAVQIIGEAASRVSGEAQNSTPSIPWRQIVAMRNRLVHAYFDIDPDEVWRVAVEEIPKLLPSLRALLPGN